MKKIVILLVLLAFFGVHAFAQGDAELAKAELHWSLDGDMLTVSVRAETEGWVAAGLGSPGMNDSAIFIGYVSEGKVFFEEHSGIGHGHRKEEEPGAYGYDVSEEDGITALTFSVKKSDFVSAGAKELPVIVAFGAKDNFTSMHRYRESRLISF